MSGHSKWSTIKRKKGAIDSKRSKIFSRIIKEISIAVSEGGNSDPDGNPRLRLAIANAKNANMPKDNIQRAISKADKDSSSLEEIVYEGYGPKGVAIFVECLTDNHLRSVGFVRSVFTKNEGTLGTQGSLSFLFNRNGIFTISHKQINIEELELELIDAGLEEIEELEDIYILSCAFENYGRMQKKLEELNIDLESAELQRIPSSYQNVDLDTALIILKMIETLEDHDDVQSVFHNMEMTDEIAAALEQ